jgi:hypothetical protein
MRFRWRSGPRAAFVLLTLIFALAGASAQTPKPGAGGAAPAGAQDIAAANGQPDVVIMVFPLSNGQYTISASYAKETPKRQTEDAIQQVLAAGGWQGSNFSYDNRPMTRTAKDFGFPERKGNISSITGFVKGAILGDDGTLSLGPFLMGFRDVTNVHLMVAAPKEYVYRGPTSYADQRVEFTCAGKEGGVVCTAKIKDHKMEELTLPRYENAPDAPAKDARPASGDGGNALKIGAIVAASLAVGVAVFLLARRAMTR